MTYTDRYGLKAAPVSVKVAVAEPTAKEIEEAKTKTKAEEEAAAKTKVEQEALDRKAAEELAGRIAEQSSQARAAEEAARRAAESHAASGQGVAVFKSSADPDAKLAGLSLKASASGAFTLSISCPAGESSC